MSAPTFCVDEDGVHFWWDHDCLAHGQVYRDTTRMPHSGGTWHIVQHEPLTVQPSINCLGCGTHGFILNGEWVAV